jgi:hypothetical protein
MVRLSQRTPPMRPAKFFALMHLDKERRTWSPLKKHEFYRAYCTLELQLQRLGTELNGSHRTALRKLARNTFF